MNEGRYTADAVIEPQSMTRNPPVVKDYIGNGMTPFTEGNNDDIISVFPAFAFLSSLCLSPSLGRPLYEHFKILNGCKM